MLTGMCFIVVKSLQESQEGLEISVILVLIYTKYFPSCGNWVVEVCNLYISMGSVLTLVQFTASGFWSSTKRMTSADVRRLGEGVRGAPSSGMQYKHRRLHRSVNEIRR